ncbi:MAG: hypothetical protein EHM31_04330 [Candidatus Aminicenantes bacterium]|nr:MAG: hypothetical protein EHM31_04330 [Candidatus Aminicenantes bacterium]
MNKLTRASLAVLLFALFAGAAFGEGFTLAAKAGYFIPGDKLFREVYSGGPAFGLDITVPLAGPLRAWAGAEIFSKTGLLSVSEEETKVRITPLYAGLRAEFGKTGLRPYVGAAAAYFLFREENLLGSVSENGLGILTQAGVLARLGGSLWLDVFAGFRACTLRTDGDDPLEARIGGLSAGLGLAYRF